MFRTNASFINNFRINYTYQQCNLLQAKQYPLFAPRLRQFNVMNAALAIANAIRRNSREKLYHKLSLKKLGFRR